MFQAAALASVKSNRFKPSSSYTPGCIHTRAILSALDTLLRPWNMLTREQRMPKARLVSSLIVMPNTTRKVAHHADSACAAPHVG